jgi:hypothetical protein
MLSPPQPTGSVSFDFDGDGKADIARWQPSSGEWRVKSSANAGAITNTVLGSNGQTIVPADYDGDGKTDHAVFNPTNGNWTIKRSSDGTTQTVSGFGQSGDKIAVGDFDGDGKADPTYFHPSNGVWAVKQSSDGNVNYVQFGTNGDIPVAGNYDGDNKTDYAIFRPSTGDWWILFSSTGGSGSLHWGVETDIPVPADYDGDGKTDFAVYRGSTGAWYIYKSSGSGQYIVQTWGNYGDQPVAADYDNDGKADLAVWRPTTGVWYISKSCNYDTTCTGNNLYEYNQLGISGEVPVPSAYIKQIGGQVLPYDLAKARLMPRNSTGGTDLYSQNFGWSTGLVSLLGRAGLNAGFGISYNSLVWTKQANTMVFDADSANVSPGFRFGFSTIEPAYYDSQTGRFAYLMVSPSGARIEFKQTAASGIYETTDSSYTQLKIKGDDNPNTPPEDLSITVTATDGTQMSYDWKAGAFRCSQIKDRNGNYITIEHDEQGLLKKVTDTLGRIITVNYDAQLDPVSIKQTWQNGNGEGSNVEHTWASFTYGAIPISADFGTMGRMGPQNGTTLKVLNKISYADNSSTRFDYNSYGQVWGISNYAADQTTEFNRIAVNLETVSGAQSDCPRFTQTKTKIYDPNGPIETVVNNSFQPNQPYSVPGNMPGASGSATLIEVSMQNHPNASVSRTFVNASGWKEGLPIVTEDLANEGQGLQRKRWTWTNYTQDDENLSYVQNPRVTETKVGDETNTKRVTYDYELVQGSNVSVFGLVKEVKVYDTDQTTVLKRSVRSYNLANEYISRRIIGLPLASELYDKNNALVSKVTYKFDQTDFSGEGQNISPVQHDNAGYGANFVVGRGNLTHITRWDVNNPSSESSAVTATTKYNTAGSTVSQIDPVGRQVKISYADAFGGSQSGITNTYAYPTKLTTPGAIPNTEVSSFIKYRYDIGANIWAKSPAAAGNQYGKETVREFDSSGRLIKQQIIGGAYTRYEYPDSQNYFKVFTTVTDANNSDAADAADEVLTETWTDGAGRTRMTRAPLKFNTSGNPTSWTGQVVEYDLAGRTKRQAVPTEIDANWTVTGDDTTRGWQWTSAQYDWKGRVTKEIGLDNVERNYSYDGCGCAGGEVVTITGEELEPGKNRRQKIYSDILGRQWKTETLNYDGTVYTTSVNVFNGRDQVTTARQYEGAEGGAVYQEALNYYDGHGRLEQTHAPQQDDGKFTAYTYYADDRPHTVTDARGATSVYTYNNRGLIEQIEQSVPVTPQPSMPGFAPCEDGTQSCIAPEDSVAGNTYSPYGFLDSADSTTGIISGWSADVDSPSTSNEVHIYIDGTAGSGAQGFVVVADRPRPDVNTNANIPGNHGFEFQLPAQYADGKPHLIYAYGIDVAGGNPPRLLTNSPKSILLMPTTKVTTFEYDDLGNRTEMTDETGSTNYEYDRFSRLKKETKHLRDSWTIPTHDFAIEYGYDLVGQLKSVTDPFGQRIDYNTDKIGKLKAVTGTPFNSWDGSTTTAVTNYIDNIEYRAWGAIKSIDYGNSTAMTQTFNSRLQLDEFRLFKDGQTDSLIKKNYQYYNDGKLKFSSDNGDTALRIDSHRFDRSYSFDQMGRLTAARTGAEARGETTNPDRNITPYKQDYQYNVFGNPTSRQTYTWTEQDNETNEWTNNRKTTWLYDADGRLKHTPENNYDYDASGAVIKVALDGARVTYNQADGAGKPVRRDIYKTRPANGFDSFEKTEYQIYSSVLGKLLTEVKSDGTKKKTYVYAGGALLATQNVTSATSGYVSWENTDPSNASYLATMHGGTGIYSGEEGQAELDPLGSNVGTSNPFDTQNQSNLMQAPGGGTRWGDPFGGYSCRLDGFETPCSQVMYALSIGAGDIDFLHSDVWALGQLGIYYHLVPGRNDAPTPPGGNPGTAYGTRDRYEYYISGNWWNSLQTVQTRSNYDIKVVEKAVKNAIKLTKNKDCDEALADITDGAIPSLNALVSKYLDANGNLVNIADGSNRSAGKFGKDNPAIPAFVENAGTANAQTYINSAFFSIGGNQLGNEQAKAIVLIHEAVHQFLKANEFEFYHKDIYYNEKWDGNQNYSKDQQEAGSKKLTELIVNKCYPVLKVLIESLKNI